MVAQGRDFRVFEDPGDREHAFTLRASRRPCFRCLLLVDGVGCTLATPSPTQDYVYGILAKSGVGDRAHNLAHMMASGLCDKADVNLDLGFGVDGGGIGA